MRRYEGLFLFDSAAGHDWSRMEGEIRRLCDRIQANLQACVKFDERKLAYEIKGCKRGTYVLTYFDAEPARIADLERDVQLSESVLRALVLRADKVSDQRLAELRARPPDQPLQPLSGEGRRGEARAKAERARAPREPGEAKAAPAAEAESAGGSKAGEATAEPATPSAKPQEQPAAEVPPTRPAESETDQ